MRSADAPPVPRSVWAAVATFSNSKKREGRQIKWMSIGAKISALQWSLLKAFGKDWEAIDLDISLC